MGILMGNFLIIIAVLVAAVLVFISAGFVRGLRFPSRRKNCHSQNNNPSGQPDLQVLNCRVKPEEEKNDDSLTDIFNIEICGSIHNPPGVETAIVKISIIDITDGPSKTKTVQTSFTQWQTKDSDVFCYNADLGRIPQAGTTVLNWIAIARLHAEWLIFPRKGKRELQFNTSILSPQNEEFSSASYILTYENDRFGYIDLQENSYSAKTLAVTLAMAVSAADNNIRDCEIALIEKWAKSRLDISSKAKDKHKLNKALKKAVTFLRNGNRFDIRGICDEIINITPVSDRYDILELCLYVVRANAIVTLEELTLLKNLAIWFEIDLDRFRSMMGKILPSNMHEVKTMEFGLGITEDMSKEQTRLHLNDEYRKWNARVTSSDSGVQAQANHMLNFIAETRSQNT